MMSAFGRVARPSAGRLLSSAGTGKATAASRRTLFTGRKRRGRFIGWSLTGLAAGGLTLWYASDSRAGIHRWLVVPAIQALTSDDPEKAHKWSIAMLASGFAPKDMGEDDASLSFKLWGRDFSNPVGLAAGYDKHAEAIDALLDLGFGYVEVGSVTPEEQEGNPKPRVFRVPETQTVVNRYGFNSEGHNAVLGRLRERIHAFVYANPHLLPTSVFPPPSPAQPFDPDPVTTLLKSPKGKDAQLIDAMGLPRSTVPGHLLAINLGKNKFSAPEAVDDFVKGVARLGPFADVLVVNVSSPNTPGLRSLQRAGIFEELLQSVKNARDALPGSVKPGLLVKVAPDLSIDELEDIALAARQSSIDGIIVSNTTVTRPASAGAHPHLSETGGLSGPPLKDLSLSALQALYTATDGSMPLIGCGGISNAADVADFGRAGASFVQMYTGLTYQGAGMPRKIKDELAQLLNNEGKRWSDLVGSDVKLPTPEERQAKQAAREQLLAQAQQAAALNKLTNEVESALEKLGVKKALKEEVQNPTIVVEKPLPSSPTEAIGAPADTSGQQQQQQQQQKTSPQQSTEDPVPFSSLGKIFSTIGERGTDATKEPGKRLV